MTNENSKFEIRNSKYFNFILRAKREVQNIVLGFQPRTIILVGLIKKPIIRILLLGVLFLVVIFTSIEVFKNPNTNKFGPLTYPKDQMVVGKKMPPTKLTFSFSQTTKIPNNIFVYRIQSPSEDKNRSFFDSVSRSLGATVSAQTKTFGKEKMYSINQKDFYFSGNLATGYFSFNGKSSKTLDTTDEDSIKLSGWDFLSVLGIINNISNNPDVAYYNYAGGEPSLSKNVLLSDVVSLSYPAMINSIPLVGLGSTEMPLKIALDKKNKNVVELDLAVPAIETKTFGQYSLLSLGDITKSSTDRFSVLSLIDKSGERLANYANQDLVSINFNNISLVYYITPEAQGLLQPMFILKGNATLKDGRSGTITTLLPAAKNVVTATP